MSTVARQSGLRSQNLSTVVRQVLAAPEAPSRADIAARTGLTRSTVSRLVDELIAEGFLTESPPLFDGHRGRPAVPLLPRAEGWVALGLELNVGHTAARLVDLTGTVLQESRVEAELSGSDPAKAIRGLARQSRKLLKAAPPDAMLAGVHLALPGLVDTSRGILLRAPNLGWHEVDARRHLSSVFGSSVPVGISNEADCAAMTISWTAPGRPSEQQDFLYVSGEHGIGSALVNAGDVRTGRNGWAGEIGHVCVSRSGRRCGCGATGCLETYVGQAALCASAGADDAVQLRSLLEAGDQRAHAAVSDAATRLGIVLAGALNLLDVSEVVLGGHLAVIAEFLIPPVLDELRPRVLSAPFAPPRVSAVTSDPESASLGAAYTALQSLVLEPARWMTAGVDAPA
ncbi:putative NBD/HSP70 family sugar kinase [Propionibacteriaceae bacterium ES.041]|uniref:ROK family transcriptional regulator n=1 Tax=Enemella evansiae TaxID=2016499 RepID=UPI000B960F55|nr:ROK family transcriptional regulator [Enemella evansiae]OYN97706.1 hypothetical protein CGZ96_10275 [Enemella evansiae]PFG65718.1 putative NBD/HSP70 family sugar kinase [Propionibacteriaceae bacterium ES.041]